MNAFAEKLKASAAEAARAAQNFQGFDEMAANDEYIHTEGYNAPQKSKQPLRFPEQQQPEPLLMNMPDTDETSTLSTHDSLLQRGVVAPAAETVSHGRSSGNIVPLKVDVPERNPRSGILLPLQLLKEEELSVSSDESEDDDPILRLIRKKEDATIDTNNNNGDEPNKPEKKHRFLHDLDTRIAMPEQTNELPHAALAQQNRGLTTQNTNTTTTQPLPSWLQTAARKLGMPPLANKSKTKAAFPFWSRKKEFQPAHETMEIPKVSATFNQSEREQLALLLQEQKNSNVSCVIMATKHIPREGFILFTLILAALVFFYYNNRSLED